MKIALLVAGALADVFDESLDDHWHSGEASGNPSIFISRGTNAKVLILEALTRDSARLGWKSEGRASWAQKLKNDVLPSPGTKKWN